jgi:catechol 2,3-dioxygenase-like lactoylglutathione lyase family enzyme
MEPLDGLHHVALTVSNLEKSAAWYTDVLRLVEQFKEDSPTRKAAVFRFPGGAWSVGLVEHVGSQESAFDPTATGLDHFAFSVRSQDEMREWALHLDTHDVQHSGPIEVPPGEILNFKDPDGIAIALFWDKPT